MISSFELDKMIISLIHHETISFQMFDMEYLMSYIEFSMVMGLVDVEYTHTKSYFQLHVGLLFYLSADQVWNKHFEVMWYTSVGPRRRLPLDVLLSSTSTLSYCKC